MGLYSRPQVAPAGLLLLILDINPKTGNKPVTGDIFPNVGFFVYIWSLFGPTVYPYTRQWTQNPSHPKCRAFRVRLEPFRANRVPLHTTIDTKL